MKLSEAIRLGAMLAPQLRAGRYWWTSADAAVSATCAIGAALHAVNALDTRRSPSCEAIALWPLLNTAPAQCPECWAGTGLFWVITHLNDTHGWTREHIADWLEQIEAQQDQGQAEAPREPVAVEVATA